MKKPFKYLLVIFVLSFSFSLLKAQNQNLYISLRTHYGFVWSHHDYMDHLVESHFPAYEINIGKQTDGSKDWQRFYNLPEIGAGYWYSNLGHSTWLGEAHGVFPYIKFPWIRREKFNFNFRLGCGVGYMTRTYDRSGNYKNMAIGSHINVFGNFVFTANHQLTKQLVLDYGFGLSHLSNGSVKIPNRGLNILTAQVGLKYFFEPQVYQPKSIVKFDRNDYRDKIKIIGAFSRKEIQPASGKHYLVTSLGACYMFKTDKKRSLGPGFDLFYDSSNKARLEGFGDTIKSNVELLRPAINFSHEWEISKLSIILQLGGYLYARDKNDGYVYNRLSLQYQISEKIFFNASLKSHWAKADYIQWGLGYKFLR